MRSPPRKESRYPWSASMNLFRRTINFMETWEKKAEEAEEIEHHLEAEYERIEEEKHVIHVEHSQKTTDKGVVLIDTYTKEEQRR